MVFSRCDELANVIKYNCLVLERNRTLNKNSVRRWH